MTTEFTSIAALLAGIYLAFAVFLYFYQRRLIYIPVPHDAQFDADELRIDNRGTRLHGWVLNPGRRGAVIYFGGNSEMISERREYFEEVFRDYSVYLFNYRGYGNSEGRPTEAGLFSDALAIYDRVEQQHQSIIAYGRSLGSGIAVHLAAERPLDRLILLTPYDSIAAVGQQSYPLFPVRLLIRDRFDSAARAGEIREPVMIAAAGRDRVIRLPRTLALKQAFGDAPLTYESIAGAAHDDIVEFPEYREAVSRFLRRG